MIALFWRLRRLDRRRPLVQGRVPLVVLTADEAVEVLEAAAAGRPRVERSGRAGLPHRHLVAFAELRRRVAIELEGQRERRLGVGQHRAVAGRCRGDFGDAAHADRVMVASGEQRLPRRRAQRGRVEARVPQSALGELLEVRGLAWTAEHAGRAVADVVDEDHQHVGRALRRPHVPDRRELRVRVLGVVGDQTRMLDVGNRETRSLNLVVRTHSVSCSVLVHCPGPSLPSTAAEIRCCSMCSATLASSADIRNSISPAQSATSGPLRRDARHQTARAACSATVGHRRMPGEPRSRSSVSENCGGGGVIQQHRRGQPAPSAARAIFARQPAGDAQREQRRAGHAADDQRCRPIERCPEQ